MQRRRIIIPLLTLLSATACTVVLPAAPTPDTGTQPVFVSSGPAGKNPIIQSFTANPTNVIKGQPITFQVVAHDPNNETLQFNWSATGGTLSATTGQALMWTPPGKPGVYTVIVTITNGRGGIVTGSQNLTVQANGAAAIGGATPRPTSAPSMLPSTRPSTAPIVSMAPSSPAPTLSPSPVPSSLASSSSIGPAIVGTQMDQTSMSPGGTQSPIPSLCAADSIYPSLDYTVQEGSLDMLESQSYTKISPVTVRYHSASNKTYWMFFALWAQTTPHNPWYRVPRASGYANRDGVFDAPHITIYSNKNALPEGIEILQFVPYDGSKPSSDTMIKQIIRTKDCMPTLAFLKTNAVPIARANWPGTWPEVAGQPRLDKTAFVFKLEQQAMDLGTFELP